MNYLSRVIKEFDSNGLLTSPKDRDLLPELVRFLPPEPADGRDTFSVLDIGSGPTTRLGARIKGEPSATITAVDQHADDYLAQLEAEGLDVPVKPLQLRAEQVSAHFPPDHFDLIFMRNVIHELDEPEEVLRSLVPLLRRGCSILVYNVADGRVAKYGGSVRWELERVKNNIVLSRRDEFRLAFTGMSGVSVQSFHQTSNTFARLRIVRHGLNWREIRSHWESGKGETMVFWSERAADPEAFPGFKQRFDAELPLHGGIAKYLPVGDSPVSILDVGSGPATNIGHTVPGRRVELTCLDVMADTFNKLLADHGLQAPVPPIYGDAEKIGQQFDPGTFDVVFSRNALDHVADPFSALTGMLAVTKPDGCVIVWGHVNEGENEKYHGYHQWNFCWEDGDFVIWRPGHRQRVSQLFAEKVYLKSEGSEDLYRIVISRRPIL